MDKFKDSKKTGDELAERLLDFAVRIIKLINALPKTVVGKHIGGQLMRSGTSPGSNYEVLKLNMWNRLLKNVKNYVLS
jgi:hypothetical protein